MRRFILACAMLAFFVVGSGVAEDTPKAGETRKKLEKKISVEFKDTKLSDALDELKTMVPGVFFLMDTKGGVSRNQTLTFKADEMTVHEILAGMFQKNGLGYYVISEQNNARDGFVMIKQGKERGYLAGQEPKETEPKDTPKEKTKTVVKDKPKDEPKPVPDDNPDEKAERVATLKLRAAKGVLADGNTDRAKELLMQILKQYPKTKAAEDAKKLLDGLQ